MRNRGRGHAILTSRKRSFLIFEEAGNFLEATGVREDVGGERLSLSRVGGIDQVGVPDAQGIGLYRIDDPLRITRSTIETGPHITKSLAWFNRSPRHWRCPLVKSDRFARYAQMTRRRKRRKVAASARAGSVTCQSWRALVAADLFQRTGLYPSQYGISVRSTPRHSSRRSRRCSVTAPIRMTTNQALASAMIAISKNGISPSPQCAAGLKRVLKANSDREG
jgi:hypothetical protein